MIIEYCEGCGLRITESDGAPVKIDNKPFHAKCAPQTQQKKASGRSAAVSASQPEAVAVQGESRISKTGMRPARRDSKIIVLPKTTPASGASAAAPGYAAPSVAVAKPGSGSKLMVVGGGIAAVAGLALIFAFGGSNDDPEKKTANRPTVKDPTSQPNKTTDPSVALQDPGVAKPESTVQRIATSANPDVEKEFETRRNEFAARLLQEAKAWAKDHPKEPKKYRDKLNTLVTTYRSTPSAEEAAKLIVDLKLPEPPTPIAPAPPEKLVVDEEAWKQAVSLIPLVDLPKDASGQWKADNGTLVCMKTGKDSKLHLPYLPGEEYDLKVVFTRNEGNDALINYLTAAGRAFIWALSADTNKAHGFGQVNGAPSTSNPTTVKGKIDNNRKYVSVVQIRADGVKAFLDGVLISQRKTDFKDMSVNVNWKMHNDTAIGVAASNNVKVTYHSIEVLDVKGTGKPMRDAAGVAGAGAAQAPKTEPGKPIVDDSAAAAATAKIEYEKLMSDVYGLLSKDGLQQAQARLEKAKADKQLASFKDDLELDAQLASYVDDLSKAGIEGAKVLLDKRPFTFKKTDGKEVVSGKGSSISVVAAKDDSIQIEETAGGGKIQATIAFDQLAPQTKLDLARLGIAPGGESVLKLAFGEFLLLQSGSTALCAKDVRGHLELARKSQAPAERLKHLAARLDFYELESGAEGALHKLEALAKEKKWESAKGGLEEYKRDYLGTKALVKLQPEIEKLTAEIEYGLNPFRPGLWASFWSGDAKDRFKVKHLARAETKISQDWAAGSPDKTVPNDNFGVIWAGVLRIEQDKKYKFTLKADDGVSLKIDGRAIKTNEEVLLAKGEREIQIVFWDGGGNASVNVKWKPEGGKDEDLPAALMFHDPRQIEKYEKK